jgi:hypothetical protein
LQLLLWDALINALILPAVGRMPAGRRPFSRSAKYFKILNSQDGLPAAIPRAGDIIEG